MNFDYSDFIYMLEAEHLKTNSGDKQVQRYLTNKL